MQYDDMVSTVLSYSSAEPAASARVWRQLIDLFVQGRVADDAAAAACARLREMRGGIAVIVRAGSAERLRDRSVPMEVVRLFAEEPVAIGGGLLASACLRQDQWAGLLPDLSSRALRVLAERTDLPPAIALAVARPVEERHAPSAVPAPGLPDAPGAPASGDQIRELLGRIEAFRSRARAGLRPHRMTEFAFVSDAEGCLHTIEGHAPELCPPDPIGIGEAWRRRDPIDGARYVVAAGPLAGAWQITARPAFDPAGGFLGYRGVARRMADARERDADADADGEREPGFGEMVGALRRPLDAIAAFGGAVTPAAPAAADVVQRSLELMAAVEEYDAAAAVDGGRHDRIDAAAVLQRLHAAFLPVAQARGVALGFRIADRLPPAFAEPAAVERMFARLLGSVLGIARSGERVAVRLGRDRREGRMLALSVARPGRLAGRDEARLLASHPVHDGLPEAPLMALGFALRLVRNLAEEIGGRLEIGDDRLLLLLPLREGRVADMLASNAPTPLSPPLRGGL